MAIHYTLNYYLEIGYLPILDRFRRETINFEFGCFIGIDVCLPLHKVLEMEAQSLKGTWKEVNKYVEDAFLIITEEYNEDLDIEEGNMLRDVDREIIYEIKEQLKTPPKACYPIYIITVGDDEEERVVYIGKTSSSNHRFSGGHRAALKLHAPKYQGIVKHIYFGTVTFLGNDKEYIPLEFIQPYEVAVDLLNSLEAGLIFNLKPELNRNHVNRNNARYDMIVNIENYSTRPKLLHNKQVFIQR